MINFFPPGSVATTDQGRDLIEVEQLQKAHEEKLKEYFGGEQETASVAVMFVAIAEIYYPEPHLEDVALFHDYLSWDVLKHAILSDNFPVPDVRTPRGMAEARRLLLDD